MYEHPQNNQRKNLGVIIGIIVVAAILVFLIIRLQKGDKNTPVEPELAMIESVEVELLERFPVEAQVIVDGFLPDSCATLGPIGIERDVTTFFVTIPVAHSDQDKDCSEVATAFERTIPLNILGLVAGTYIVDVNGVIDDFTLEIDNAVSTEFDKG